MADRTFEIALDRLFAEAPVFADGDLFAARVEGALNRGWGFRQTLIGGLGLIGGLIGGAQILGSGLAGRLGEASEQSRHVVSQRLADLAAVHVLPAGFLVDGEVVWMSAGLAVIALGFAIGRAIREI